MLKMGRKGSAGQFASSTKQEIVGSVRQNQLMYSFGIGAITDFADVTAMIMGTDHWYWENDCKYKLNNKNLETLLGVRYFVRPKLEEKSGFAAGKSADVEATLFPRMLYCLACRRLVNEEKRFLSKGKMTCSCGNGLVPTRFVAVCPKGHIEDFPYSWWIHSQANPEYAGAGNNCRDPQNLIMYYTNNRTDIANLWIECKTCGAKQSMRNASSFHALANYPCSGSRPWLGKDANESGCTETLRMCMRTESNVYFPITKSALTIPPFSDGIATEIQRFLNLFSTFDEAFLKGLRKNIVTEILKKPAYKRATPDYIERMITALVDKSQQTSTTQSILEDEYMALSGDANHDGNFITKVEETPKRYSSLIKKVVAIERLTVVTALTGFTRLQADGGERGENIAPLSIERKEWLPATEQRGEGIFIEFNEAILQEWADYTCGRYNAMAENLDASLYEREDFSPQFVFLHTFAHLLIRELSNICGYSAVSMKEKIYSTYPDGSQMSGILIYTSSADAEGSLGGLTEQASKENLQKLIDALVERASWCSMDPICSSTKGQGVDALNYAACYACALVAETTCEFRNILLDRVAVVGTVDDKKMGVLGWLK